jgi:hypothetical protein
VAFLREQNTIEKSAGPGFPMSQNQNKSMTCQASKYLLTLAPPLLKH